MSFSNGGFLLGSHVERERERERWENYKIRWAGGDNDPK